LPLAMFALGSLVDLFREKSPAPLLMASLFGYGAAAFIALYHFFMLDVVMNFDHSAVKVVPLALMALVVMPMLLAFVRNRELTWQPARWLTVAILTGCFVHLFLPGFTAERPRDMTLMYTEVEGAGRGHVALDSVTAKIDRGYARSHDFTMQQLNDGRLGTVERPAREVVALGLPGVQILFGPTSDEGQGWRRELRISSPVEQKYLQISLPLTAGLEKAWINGELALDTSIETKRERKHFTVRLIYPGPAPVKLELLTTSPESVRLAVVTWHDLPGVLTAPFLGNWPDEARPAVYGPRAEHIQEFTIDAVD